MNVIVYDFRWYMTLDFYMNFGGIWHWISTLVIYDTGDLLHLLWYWIILYMFFGCIFYMILISTSVLYTTCDLLHLFWIRIVLYICLIVYDTHFDTGSGENNVQSDRRRAISAASTIFHAECTASSDVSCGMLFFATFECLHTPESLVQ
jgi:hypothetical protein